MGLYNHLPDEINEVDVIIAGGGAAGCIIAGRLAETDPSLSILLIESGPNNDEDPAIKFPAFWLSHMVPTDKYIRAYKSDASDHLSGREAIVSTSRVLGGGSSINTLVYSRPQRSEFDAWNTPGWSASDMLHYMNKFESYHGSGLKEHHGHDGPLYIGPGVYRGSALEDDFINAMRESGLPELEDNNNLDSINGPMRAMRYVNPSGTREDVAHAYLHPKLESGNFPNLHVLVETDVERVLFDDHKKAIGVAFRLSPTFQIGTESVPSRIVTAKKKVVLSAGACGTPAILERSGIGSPEVLARAGVQLLTPLPAVGEHYQDHHIVLYAYKTSVGPEETMDAFFTGRRLDVPALIAKNDSLLSWNGVDVQCKLRPSDADVVGLGRDFEAGWNKHFKNFPDKPMMIISTVSCFPGDPSSVPEGQYMGIATFSVHPFSRGRIHITGPNMSDQVALDTGFLADEGELDVKKHIWMYKKQREILRRMDTFMGEVASGHPEFPVGSKAAVVDGKVASVEAVEYTPEDDKAIEKFLRENVASCWHSLGTCRMAPLEAGGVVDGNLNIYGVSRLKVADLSIAPGNVGANTCSTAMAIGEKAADILIGELGLVKKDT